MQHSVKPGHRGRTLRLRFACRTEDDRSYSFDMPLFAGVARSSSWFCFFRVWTGV